jgi:hypothetical protein
MYQGPGFYQHYKGSFYKVIGVGVEEETLEPVVIYHPIRGSENDEKLKKLTFSSGVVEYWTRPIDDFNDEVRLDGEIVSRFEMIPEEEVTAT